MDCDPPDSLKCIDVAINELKHRSHANRLCISWKEEYVNIVIEVNIVHRILILKESQF